jgi:hypothetical protein
MSLRLVNYGSFICKLFKNIQQAKSKYKNKAGNYKNKSAFNKIVSNLNQENNKLIYLHHEWGGGTDLYLQNKIANLKNENYIFVIIYKKKLNKLNLQITFKEEFASVLFNNFEELLDLFGKIKIDEIYVNQISFFPDIDVVFNFIKQIKSSNNKATMLIHDFSSICKNTNLTKDDGTRCDIIDNKNYCNCSVLAQENVRKWQEFLNHQIDEILCFSNHSKQVVSQFYPSISSKINIVTHYVPFLRKVNIVKTTKELNIAVIGSLNRIKGCDLVEEMSQIIISSNLPIKIFIIGKCKKKANLALKILGKYDRKNLPEIIENNQIDLVFISSICPETFSYTTHEAMLMGMKIACFDLGAQSEYVKKYDKGLIISKISAKTALDEISNFVK